jgi:hypothetical protein
MHAPSPLRAPSSPPDDDDVFFCFFFCFLFVLEENKNERKAIYPKGTSHHTSLFRGPSTNDMKK